MERVQAAGVDSRFFRRAILPSWWTPDCESDPSLLQDVEFMVARFFGVPLATVRDPAQPLSLTGGVGVHLKAERTKTRTDLKAAIHATEQVLAATVRAMKNPPPVSAPPDDPGAWRQMLQHKAGVPSLASVGADLWERGIPVVSVEVLPAGKKYMGLASEIDGRPVIAIAYADDVPARLLFWLAHEAAHIALGHCAGGAVIVDEDEPDLEDAKEQAADDYAIYLLNGRSVPPILKKRAPAPLAEEAERVGGALQIDPGHLIMATAKARRSVGEEDAYAVAHRALEQLWLQQGGQAELRRQFDQHVDLLLANEDDRSLLRCIRFDPERDAAGN